MSRPNRPERPSHDPHRFSRRETPPVLETLEPRLLLSVTYPSLQQIYTPADNPTLPGAMDVFAPPVDSQTPAGAAPVFAEWSRFADPDDTVPITGDAFSVYSGDDFGMDTRFIVYGQTGASDATTTDGLIRVLQDNQASITLDGSLPDDSMYLVWAQNDAGVSYPFAINKAEPWWIGPAKAAVGETVSFFGRNLSHDGGTTTSWVYLQPSSGAGQWITPTAVNPYKVDFVVPSGLANGSYEVYVHNGHGGAYGWSKPLTLTVQDAVTWVGTTRDVTSYGAVGDGVTDDGAAIQAALDASGDGDTIYFPAGTYLVGGGRTFSIPAKRTILGDGRTASTIKVGLNSGSQLAADFMVTNSNTRVQSIGLDENFSIASTAVYAVLRMSGDFKWLSDVLVHSNDNRTVITSGQYTFITGSRFNGTTMSVASNTYIDDCDFYGMYDCEMVIDSWSGSQISITNSTVQDFDPSNPNSSAGFGEGRFFRGTPVWGTQSNIYIGDNVTTDCSPRPLADQNSGEQVLSEGQTCLFNGDVLAATSNTLRFANYTYGAVGSGARITIIDGKGLGQTRQVSSYDAATDTITILGTWNVIPDATSYASMNYTVQRWAVYNNYFDAKDNAAGQAVHVASTAVSMYQGSIELVVDGNTSNQTRHGFILDGASYAGDVNPCFFSQITNNTIQNNRTGISIQSNDYAHLGLGDEMVGVVLRGNTISNELVSAIENGRSSGMVIEHNSAVNTPKGLVTNAAETTFVYDNSFSRGTAALAGSVGVQYTAQRAGTLLAGNAYSDFALTYGGNYLPGPELSIGYRRLQLAAAVGARAQTKLPLSNMGLGNLAWTLNSSSTWLTVLQNDGINPGDTIDDLIVVADAQHLSAGTYTEVLTFTGDGQTIKVNVEFTVGTAATYPHPIASNDSYVVHQDTPLYANAQNGVLADDYDIAGHALTAVKQSDPLHGALSFNSDGTFTYTPTAGFLGYDRFTYKAYDGSAYSDTKTVTLVVINPLEALPVMSGLVTWLDAGRLAGYGDGEDVILWTDRSGNDKNATGTANGTPTYQSNVINGQPVLRFDGSNDWLKISNLPATGPVTMFMVFSSSNTAGRYEWAIKDTVGSVANTAIKYGGTTYISYPAVTGFNLKTYTLNGSSSSVKTDGTTVGTGNVERNGLEYMYLGARSTSIHQAVDFAEVLLYDRVLTAGEENEIGYYLATKYGLTTAYSPVVTIEATDPTAAEAGADAGQFRVSRGAAISGDLTVNYTVGGTASGSDYTPSLSGSVTIPDGAAAAFININAVNDALSEGPESLVLTLAAGTGYHIGEAAAATVDLLDDDRPVVQIDAIDHEAYEVGPDAGKFLIVRNTNSGDLTVNYSVSGTAAPGDYSETLSGSVVIPDGQYTATITVTPVNDSEIENDEALTLTLNATANYQLGAAYSDTVNFHSEDLPSITIAASDANASEAGPDAGGFTVTRSGTGLLTQGDLTVHYTIGGTATNGADYSALSGVVVIPDGQTSVAIPVAVIDDALDESNETVLLTVTPAEGYTVGTPSEATVTIADDDPDVTPTVSIAATDPAAVEGSTGTFTVTRADSTRGDITVNYSVSGSASGGSDYTALSGSVVIPDGRASATITVTAIEDQTAEPNESVTLTLGSGSGYTVGTPSVATVRLADVAPVLVGHWALNEGSGTTAYDLAGTANDGTLTNGPVYEAGVLGTGLHFDGVNDYVNVPHSEEITPTVGLTLACWAKSDNATWNANGLLISKRNSFILSARSGSRSIALYVCIGGSWKSLTYASDIDITEWHHYAATYDGKHMRLYVDGEPVASQAQSGLIDATTGNLSIGRDLSSTYLDGSMDEVRIYAGALSAEQVSDLYDAESGALPTVSLVATDASAAEAGPDTGTFTITRDQTSGDLTVYYTVSGTASAGDYSETLSGSVTILDGQASAVITVTPVDDSDIENAETLTLTLASDAAYALGGSTSGTVTITSDDVPTVTLIATDAVASETGPDVGTFTLTRSGSGPALASGDLAVNYTIGGTATNTSDYSTLSGSVTIPDGQTSVTVTITPIDDTEVEGSETVALTLAAGAGYTVGSPAGDVVTIADNDTPTVTLAVTDGTATEAGQTPGEFTVTRTGPTSGDLTVNYTLAGSAVNGIDYSTLSGSVTILDGQASAVITVTPIDDSDDELTETVTVALAGGTGYAVGSPSTGAVTITSDDSADWNANLVAYWSFDEGSGTTVADLAGSTADDGTFVGNPVYESGVVGKALHFDGVDDYVSIPHSSEIAPSTALTVACWAKSDNAAWNANGLLVSKRDSFILSARGGTQNIGLFLRIGGAWKSCIYVPQSLDITTWHHYAATYDGSQMKVYVDGVLVKTTSRTGTLDTDTNNLYIGRDLTSTLLDGSIDEVRLYNAALSDTGIEAIYDQVALSVTNLNVTSGNSADYGVQAYALAAGAYQYGDRTDTFSTIPTQYLGLTYIRTANDDALSTGADLLSFTVNQTCEVYILHDDSITTKPSWLTADFTDTGDNVATTAGTFSVYKAIVSAGTIVLGGNTADGLGSGDMYSVLIRPVL